MTTRIFIAGTMNAMQRILTATILAAFTLTAANPVLETKLQQAIDLMETRGDLHAALKLFEEVAGGRDRNLAARSLLYLGACYQKLGKDGATSAYERVVRDFSDQPEAATEARNRLDTLRQPIASGMMTRRVWGGRDVDSLGNISRDGRYLSYAHWVTGDLGVRDLSTGANRLLTSKGTWNDSDEYAESSVISPDGRLVAYAWSNTDFRYELRVLGLGAATGTKPRILYSNEETDWLAPYDWSSDGRSILVLMARKDNTNQIAVISTADGRARTLKSLDWRGVHKMAFSPDGRYIAFDFPPRDDSDDHDIFLMATDGSREIPLVVNPGNDAMLAWAPGGKQILFASDRTGQMGLWSLNIENGRPLGSAKLIKSDFARPWTVGMTQSGSLYYSVRSDFADISVASVDTNSGRLINSPARLVHRFLGNNRQPIWSPDGRSVAYLSSRDTLRNRSKVLAIQSFETGQVRELRPSLQSIYFPSWSPDGAAFAAQGVDAKGRRGIYRIDATTGAVSTIMIAKPGEYPNRPQWFPDGKSILYRISDDQTKGGVLIKKDIDTGHEQEIMRRQNLFRPELSPNGHSIAMALLDRQARATSLEIVPVAGGSSRRLLRVSEPEGINTGLAWTPDGRHIVFRKIQNANNIQHQTVWSIPAEGGEPVKVDLQLDNLRQLVIHPDGKRLLLMHGDNAEEIWAMDNFLPIDKAAAR